MVETRSETIEQKISKYGSGTANDWPELERMSSESTRSTTSPRRGGTATFEEVGKLVQGYLWKHNTVKMKRSRRYVVLSGTRLHYYRDWVKAMIPGAGKTLVDLSDDVEAELGVPHLSRSRYRVYENSTRLKRKLLFYPIVIRKKGKGSIIVQLFSDKEDVAQSWIRAFNIALKSDGLVEQQEMNGLPSPTPEADVDQLARDLPMLIEELRQLVKKDRYMLASKAAESISGKIRAASSTVDKKPSGEERARLQSQLDGIKKEWENAAELRKNISDLHSWATDWIEKFDSTEGWKTVSDNGDMKISFRKAEDQSLITVRVDTEIESPFVPLSAVLAEADLAGDWIPFGKGTLVHKETDLHVVCHVGLFFPFYVPMSNRDWVIEGRGIDMLESKRILLVTKSITSSELCELPEPAKGTIRINLWGSFFITLLSPTRLKLQFMTFADLQLPLSPSVLNFVNKTMGGQTIGTIKKFLKNFEHTKYPERIRRRPEFYADLQRRVDECFGVGSGPPLSMVEDRSGRSDRSTSSSGRSVSISGRSVGSSGRTMSSGSVTVARTRSGTSFTRPLSRSPVSRRIAEPPQMSPAPPPVEGRGNTSFLLSVLGSILFVMVGVLVATGLKWIPLPDDLINLDGIFMMLMALESTTLILFIVSIAGAYILGYRKAVMETTSGGQ